MIYFVHIPKTAGTSFRIGVENYLGGSSHAAYDYGPDSPASSEVVKCHVYNERDIWAFHESCKEAGIAFVAGHFHLAKYLPVMGVRQVITFVRDPVQRMVSEYDHFVRHNGFTGTLREFYSVPKFQDRQWKLLQGAPRPAVGFFGVTEEFEKSLAIINRQHGIQIKPLLENIARDSIRSTYEVSPQDVTDLRQLNQRDLALYRWCQANLSVRWQLLQAGHRFVHAHVTEATRAMIKGWAWWEYGDDPVEISIRINGVTRETLTAADYRPGLCSFGVPRQSYVGFSCSLDARPGDHVECIVASTSQVILAKELKV